jgi:hypothetical protein
VSIWLPDLGSSSWWVGTPYLAGPVILLGLVVLLRTEKVRIITLFLVVAVAVAFVRASIQFRGRGVRPGHGVLQLLWSSPFLFLGAFMPPSP